MRIAVDAMGGDHAPAAVVEGALAAVRTASDLELVLVGPPDRLQAELGRRGGAPAAIRIQQAAETIAFDEAPVQAVRRKKGSSLVVAMNMVKEQRADAFLSAGSTGAILAAGLFILGRMAGVDRPALTGLFPTRSGKPVLILDIGANTESKPEHLAQFAVMGSLYAQVLGRQRPSVALLNIGTEEGKGNTLTKAALPLIRQMPDLNFIGSIEGREVPAGEVDVVVTDGFTGNVVLKLYEGVGLALFGLIREALTSSPLATLGALLARPALKSLHRRLDWTETGGAPLLGLNAPVMKCHGSSDARAIAAGLAGLRELVRGRIVDRVREAVARRAVD